MEMPRLRWQGMEVVKTVAERKNGIKEAEGS
jgi:hypothetical protein